MVMDMDMATAMVMAMAMVVTVAMANMEGMANTVNMVIIIGNTRRGKTMSQTEEKVIDDSQEIDIIILLIDFLMSFRRMWKRVFLLGLLGTLIAGWYANSTYRAYYTASSTFTINIRQEQDNGINASTSFF